MIKQFFVSLITIGLLGIAGCENVSKNDNWITIRPGYSYQITKTDLPKDDVFRIVKITYKQDGNTIVTTGDADTSVMKSFLDINPVITRWKNELPNGISGQLRLDVDAITKELMGEIAVQIILPEHYDTAQLTSDTSWLAQQPFCKSIEYISKEEARETFIRNGGEDFQEFLDSNILPMSLNCYLTPAYVGTGKKEVIEKAIRAHFKEIGHVAFPLIGNYPAYLQMQSVLLDFRK